MRSVSTRSIAVAGMTCDHCASAVRAEISKLPGVTGIDVDVAAGPSASPATRCPATPRCVRRSRKPATSSPA